MLFFENVQQIGTPTEVNINNSNHESIMTITCNITN